MSVDIDLSPFTFLNIACDVLQQYETEVALKLAQSQNAAKFRAPQESCLVLPDNCYYDVQLDVFSVLVCIF